MKPKSTNSRLARRKYGGVRSGLGGGGRDDAQAPEPRDRVHAQEEDEQEPLVPAVLRGARVRLDLPWRAGHGQEAALSAVLTRPEGPRFPPPARPSGQQTHGATRPPPARCRCPAPGRLLPLPPDVWPRARGVLGGDLNYSKRGSLLPFSFRNTGDRTRGLHTELCLRHFLFSIFRWSLAVSP